MTKLARLMGEELVRRNYSQVTIRSYLRTLEDFRRYAQKRLEDLGPDDIRRYQVHLLEERKLAINTVVSYVAALRFFYIKTLKRRDMKEDLPYPNSPKRKRRLPVILSPEQVTRLIDSAKNLFHYTMLLTTYSAGLRRSELCRLKVSDIDAQRMMLRIERGKGDVDREVPLSQTLLETLREYWRWMRPKTYLFPGTARGWRADKPLSPKMLWRAVRCAAERAGIEKRVSPHTLRHCFATHLLEAGADLRDGPQRHRGHCPVSSRLYQAPAGSDQPAGKDHRGRPRSSAAAPETAKAPMSRPTVEVADIVQAQGSRFVDSHRQRLSYQQLKVLRAIAQCRTVALGGHVDDCPHCGHQAISYSSCRNRHCPKCQAQARQRWLAAKEKELLSVAYFHVVFTLPHRLIPLCQRNPRLLYHLLFRASAATMLQVAADPKHLGAEIGFLSILHTWGQNLLPHPYLHCVIPAGGLSADRSRWVHPKYPFFLPVKVLSRVFRGKFVAGLKRAYRRNRIDFSPAQVSLKQPRRFRSFLRSLFEEDWVVYAKPAFGGAPQVLRYLGRYTHRVAISNHRLLAFDGERVTFRWKDYAHGNKQRQMTLSATEFLRRFVQHILPRGFVRIRQFGFLANSCRTARLPLIRQLLAGATKPREPCVAADSVPLSWRCPRCGRPMRIGPHLTAVQLASQCRFFDSS